MVNIALNYNGGNMLRQRGFVVAEGLDLSNYAILLLVGDYAIRQLVLYEKDIGSMAFWELDSEVLGKFWLMASASWALWLKAFMIGEGGPCSF
jgi:hypothetical protein